MTPSGHCPACWLRGIVATNSGPTCTHQDQTGSAWFPDWRLVGSHDPSATQRRCDWLKEKRTSRP